MELYYNRNGKAEAKTKDVAAFHEAEAERLQREAEETAKAEAKQAAADKLAALGLTPEEIAAITGA